MRYAKNGISALVALGIVLWLTAPVGANAPISAEDTLLPVETHPSFTVHAEWQPESLDMFGDTVIADGCKLVTGTFGFDEIVERFPGLTASDPATFSTGTFDGEALCEGGACGCGVCMQVPNGPTACAACAACCADGQAAWCKCTGDLADQIIIAECGCGDPPADGFLGLAGRG